MTVLEHTIPFFLPVREAENDLLSSNAMVGLVAWICIYDLRLVQINWFWRVDFHLSILQKFIDYIGELLQAYVDRREQVRYQKIIFPQ